MTDKTNLKLADRLAKHCSHTRMKALGRTDYPDEEHYRDCDICQSAQAIRDLEADLAAAKAALREAPEAHYDRDGKHYSEYFVARLIDWYEDTRKLL